MINAKGPARFGSVLAIGATGTVLAACGGTLTIKQSEELSFVREALSAYGLPQARAISCPSGIEAKVGNKFECRALLPNGQQVVVVPVRVASVKNSIATLRAQSDVVNQPLAVSVIYKWLTLNNNPAAKSVDCPSGLPATQGETFNCHVTLSNGASTTFTLRVDTATVHTQNLSVTHVKVG